MKFKACLATIIVLCTIVGDALSAEMSSPFPALKQIGMGGAELSMGGDARFRYENRHHFNGSDSEQDVAYLRTRVNISLNLNRNIQAFLEGLDAREWFSGIDPRQQKDTWDFHQGFLKLVKPWNVPVSLTVGRQELSYGAKRLVSASTWSNKIKSFDAVKLAFNPKQFDFDLFFGQRVFYKDEYFNPPVWGEQFFGVYSTYRGIKDTVFDLYELNLVDTTTEVTGEKSGDQGGLKRYTIGSRGEGKMPYTPLGYGYEFAYQFGKNADDDIHASAYHVDINYLFSQVWGKPSVKVEYNFASGDKNPKDGVSQTFDPLFQTTHEPYGLIDYVRWQNIKEVGLVIDFTPIAKIFKASFQYHRFWLAETSDAWYDSQGKKVRRDLTGRAPAQLGDEIDLCLRYKVLPYWEVEPGYAHFFSGNYLKATGPAHDTDWIYVQTVFAF